MASGSYKRAEPGPRIEAGQVKTSSARVHRTLADLALDWQSRVVHRRTEADCRRAEMNRRVLLLPMFAVGYCLALLSKIGTTENCRELRESGACVSKPLRRGMMRPAKIKMPEIGMSRSIMRVIRAPRRSSSR